MIKFVLKKKKCTIASRDGYYDASRSTQVLTTPSCCVRYNTTFDDPGREIRLVKRYYIIYILVNMTVLTNYTLVDNRI